MTIDISKVEGLFETVKSAIDTPDFYQRMFSLVSKEQKRDIDPNDPLLSIIKEDYDSISRRLDHSNIQDSTAVRNQLRCRQLVQYIINDKGEFELQYLNQAIRYLTQNLYSLGPNRQYDAKRQEHLLQALKKLRDDKEVQRLLKNIGKPYANRYAEQLIKETLQPPATLIVNDPEARRAALTAWLSYLRQNVGSCFATAPAILICEEQPQMLFKDLNELFGTGRLKRTFGGVEYSVPLSASWGAGDLRRQFIVPRGPLIEKCDLWQSPGILIAFESVGIIDKSLSSQERLAQSKKKFLEIMREWPGSPEYVLVTPEDLIKKALLKKLQLTQEDIEETGPKTAIASNLMVQVATASAGGKAGAVRQFQTDFAAAQIAFKSLAENALLKSWEFTLASFSETKLQFANWNLYSSLGLGPQEPGGIGNSLFKVLQQKLSEANREVEEFQFEYDQQYGLIRYLETRLRTVSSEQEAQHLKVEYRTRKYEFEQLEAARNRWSSLAHRYANLFDPLIDLYMSLFPRYFQEVYDADMHDVAAGPYDDSPAGFRLVYKYGRALTSQWTSIQTPSEFVEALASFFIASEAEMTSSDLMQGLEKDTSDITTAIVQQIRTEEFLESAFHRMARAHHSTVIDKPLEHLDSIEKKPWAYTSGGTMDTLVSCYWRREQKPTEVGRWVENPMELLVFFADTMKQLPKDIAEEYRQNPDKKMLIHSPTHAFLFKPGLSPFRSCWEANGEFTYTAVRDRIVSPMHRFVDNIIIDQEMAQFLVAKIAEKVHPNFQFYFRQTFSYVHGGLTPPEFREHIVHVMRKEQGLKFGRSDVLSTEEIDGLLFSLLPLFPSKELLERITAIFSELPGIDSGIKAQLGEVWEKIPMMQQADSIVSAKTLQDITKALLCLLLNTTSTMHDYHFLVGSVAKKLGYSMPMPLIVADSNWARDEFGFVVNPGTGELQLWRVDYTGNVGAPMASWDQWLNGSRKDRTWGLYSRPYEYKS